MRTIRQVIPVLLAFAVAAPAWADTRQPQTQTQVTGNDLMRLETTASNIEGRVAELRTSDPTLAAEIEKALTPLKEEIIYLRVKMRREEAIARQEYSTLRDRLETLRIRAGGQTVSADPVMTDDPMTPAAHVVAVGTELDTRLQTHLNSGTAKPEDRFEATTVVDYMSGTDVVIPAGTVVRGFVSSVRPAGRLDRRGSLTLSFDEIRFGNRSYRLRATVSQALDGKVAEDATRIGAGAVIGGIIGGIFGGGKGALLGVLVGGGGTIAATEGSDVDLPVGTILRIQLDQPLEIIR
jgi:hypothetical protein